MYRVSAHVLSLSVCLWEHEMYVRVRTYVSSSKQLQVCDVFLHLALLLCCVCFGDCVPVSHSLRMYPVLVLCGRRYETCGTELCVT